MKLYWCVNLNVGDTGQSAISIAKILNFHSATQIRMFTFLFTFYAICADFGKVFKRFSLQDKKQSGFQPFGFSSQFELTLQYTFARGEKY